MGLENRVSSGDLALERKQSKQETVISRSVIKGMGRVGEYFRHPVCLDVSGKREK
jgi:hypothetical protein